MTVRRGVYNCYDKNRGLLQLSDDCWNFFTCSEELKHKMETNTRLKFQSNSTKLIAVFLEVEYMKDVSVHQIWLTASSHEILIHEIKSILDGQHTSFQLHTHTNIHAHLLTDRETFLLHISKSYIPVSYSLWYPSFTVYLLVVI